jgi:hypothetical protein
MPSTFEMMVSEAKLQVKKVKGKKRGPREKLALRDKVLMMLINYREYRTFLDIGTSYNIRETQCWRIITALEELLIKSELFHLLGRNR